jgi:dCMP deaminase
MLIINSGIVRVVCQRRYHDGADSEAMFKSAGVVLEYVHDEVQEYDRQ